MQIVRMLHSRNSMRLFNFQSFTIHLTIPFRLLFFLYGPKTINARGFRHANGIVMSRNEMKRKRQRNKWPDKWLFVNFSRFDWSKSMRSWERWRKSFAFRLWWEFSLLEGTKCCHNIFVLRSVALEKRRLRKSKYKSEAKKKKKKRRRWRGVRIHRRRKQKWTISALNAAATIQFRKSCVM